MTVLLLTRMPVFIAQKNNDQLLMWDKDFNFELW